jgi:hypothetical protein
VREADRAIPARTEITRDFNRSKTFAAIFTSLV